MSLPLQPPTSQAPAALQGPALELVSHAAAPQAAAAPTSAVAAAAPTPPQASSSLNVAIQDSKDFPGDAAPVQELYSEFALADGRALFECSGLVKESGIDLMNCPLNVVLKLRVRRRMPQGAVVLWHVVLPLPQISKYLLNPPHEWETWIGLFPSTQSLEAHPADTMFTQAVHLISRPDFPKLRLRFTYHNPELQAQISAQCEMQQQESRRRVELTQQVGRQQFEEIHKLTRGLRGTSGDSGPLERDGGVGPTAVTMQPQTAEAAPALLAGSGDKASADALREALTSALAFINSVHQMLSHAPQRNPNAPALPPALSYDEVLTCSAPGHAIDAHCMLLHQGLCALAYAAAPLPSQATAAAAAGADAAETEQLLTDGLRMALLGLLDDADSARPTRAAAAPGSEPLAHLRSRFPGLWEAYREVSAVARERAALLEQFNALALPERAAVPAAAAPAPGPPPPRRPPGRPGAAASATPAALAVPAASREGPSARGEVEDAPMPQRQVLTPQQQQQQQQQQQRPSEAASWRPRVPPGASPLPPNA